MLRHKPEIVGIELDHGGWADVSELLIGCTRAGREMSRVVLDAIVADNDKQRFEFSNDGKRIRACQGHSIHVDLGHAPCSPPSVLFHGTAHRNIDTILREGILPITRQHVHLSTTMEAALAVGQRHGSPTVLRVASGQMYLDGIKFILSTNKVWLTASVPPQYLSGGIRPCTKGSEE